MIWALHALSKDQDIQQKSYDEIMAVIGNDRLPSGRSLSFSFFLHIASNENHPYNNTVIRCESEAGNFFVYVYVVVGLQCGCWSVGIVDYCTCRHMTGCTQ